MIPTCFATQHGLQTARALTAEQQHIGDRRSLYAAGVPRWLIRREIRAGRWQRTGRQTIATHNGPLSVEAQRWVAVLEMGPRAVLDGISCLQHDGVTVLTNTEIHVTVPKGATVRSVPGVVRHESRRWREQDIVRHGLPRTQPAVAGIHAALWAVTERQALFFAMLPVQQQLCRPDDLAAVLRRVRRSRWRKPLIRFVRELAGGVRSLNELDVAVAMRERGLPEPTRQAIRRRPDGTYYLDADFEEFQVSLEVDGPQHDEALASADDLVRDLGTMAEGRYVVRIKMVAWTLARERILDGLETLFRSRGWQRAA